MKLNPDCVRDILIDVEEKSTFSNFASYTSKEDFKPLLDKYSYEESMYHIRQCEHSNLFMDKVHYFMDGGCMIKDLSPKGHQFLENIRSPKNWTETKSIASRIGSMSLNVLESVSAQVISNLISGQFNK
ncbi:DUF2513 domain-containing protein [Streptococcus agalactiae]|uniref:DUF2513 domain-containing protein n=1 Tax=Streptococcus agalactiae TaxID=1311 RepID=UPI003DA1820D